MARSAWFLASIMVTTVIIAPQLVAQDRGNPESRYEPATFLLVNVRPGTSRDAYLENLLEAFRAVDTDWNGLDRGDIARIDSRKREEGLARRQLQVERYEREIERMDADGDGGVTEKEMLDAIEYQQSGRAQVDGIFEIFDTDRDGLIDLSAIASGGWRQARELALADSNGDERLSKEEMLAAFAKTRPTTEVPNIRFAQMDIDGNGRLTAEEMAAQYTPDGLNARKTERRRLAFERLFVLDADSNGVLTKSEIKSAFLKQFARIDRDGDGVFSKEEDRPSRGILTIARSMAEAPFCDVPQPGADADILAVLAREGQLASSVAIGGQDRETSIIDVYVEPGDGPLYVLLLSESPIIWDFEGAVERISEVVIFSKDHDEANNPLVGSIGLADSDITYGKAGCMPFRKLGGFGRGNAVKLENQLGAITRLPVRVAAGSPGTIFLPSLSVERVNTGVSAPEGFDPDVWWMGTDDHPRGIADPDPASIVAATSIERFDLLPVDFGLARLAYLGVIEPTEHDDEFRLLKPLERFPGGMKESGRTNFVLSEGIARPQGELGRGCLYAADGETVIEGDYCRRYPRGNAVQIRVAADGRSCLFRYGGENAGCFPDDGRPLRAVETDERQKFEPAPADEVQTAETMSVPEPAFYQSPIEIIPAGLRQSW